MKKRVLLKRVTVAILAAAVFLSSVTGCGKKKSGVDGSASNPTTFLDKEHIFKEEDIKLTENGEDIVYLDYVNGKIKFVYKGGSGKYVFVSAGTDGSVDKTFEIPVSTKAGYPYFTMDDSDNLYMQYSADSDDANNAAEDGSELEEGTFLLKFDNTGKELFREDMSSDGSSDILFPVEGVVWTKDNGLIVCSARGIETYSEQNGFNLIINHIPLNSFEYGGFITKGNDDQLYVMGSKDQCSQLVKVDIANKKIGEPGKCFETSNINVFCALSKGEQYDQYIANSDFIYGYDSKEDKVTKIVDFHDSEIGGEINNLAVVSDTEFWASFFDENGKTRLSKLTKVNPEDVKEKTVVTLGGITVYDDLLEDVYKFNRSSDEYRIQVVDYSKEAFADGNEMEQILNKFNLDVLSGNAPDILVVSDDINIYNYIDKGVFMDMSALFDKGGAFENIEILPNVFEMMHTKGKVYTVFPEFIIETVAIRSRFADGKETLTFDDCDEIINSSDAEYKTAFGGSSSKDVVLYMGVTSGRDKYLDLENKKCNYDCADFIDLLNFANKFPEEAGYDYGIFEMDLGYLEDKAIFKDDHLYNFEDYGKLEHAVFKDGVSLIGFPNNSGENLSYIQPRNQVGINSNSKYTDVAIDFIKSMFENYDPSNRNSNFPSDKKGFETAKKAATAEIGDKEPDYYDLGFGEERIEVTPLTEAEAQKFCDYILAIKTLYGYYDGQISSIIHEESSAFFSGQKSAEETASIIQSRVTTYMNENR